MRLPSEDSAYYIFQIAAPTMRATDFALGEQAYLPASGDGAPLFVPVPAWLTMAPFFLNIHIHNHELFAEKIFALIFFDAFVEFVLDFFLNA